MQPVDIIVNNFTRLQYLDGLVKQIRIRTEYPHRIIVADNATTERTRKFIKKLIADRRIHDAVFSDKNYPLPQSFKRGFDLVKSKYFVMTVDDTVPPWLKPCWLTHLVHLLENNKDYASIALHYQYAQFDSYFKVKRKPTEFSVDKSRLEAREAIEEFFQIQRTADMRRISWSRKHNGVYAFARQVEKLGKKLGCPSRKSVLSAIAWDDENNGYLPSIASRGQFFEKKKFRNVRVVACFMAHHDDEYIDRFLTNVSKFTSEFYINLNEPSPYTREACLKHPNTKAYIETENGKCWCQGLQRQNTVRMLDNVKPDMVIFPDTDELFCDDLSRVLEIFWDSHKKSCWFEMKYCWGDENTVRLDGIFKKMVHVRAFKWQPNLTYWPYPGFACPRELKHEKRRKFLSFSPVKHLKFLKKENQPRYEWDKNVKIRLQRYNKFDHNFGS